MRAPQATRLSIPDFDDGDDDMWPALDTSAPATQVVPQAFDEVGGGDDEVAERCDVGHVSALTASCVRRERLRLETTSS